MIAANKGFLSAEAAFLSNYLCKLVHYYLEGLLLSQQAQI